MTERLTRRPFAGRYITVWDSEQGSEYYMRVEDVYLPGDDPRERDDRYDPLPGREPVQP